MSEVEVQGTRLPGVGWRYDLDLPRATRLVVVVEDAGRRHIMITHSGQDDALVGVALRADQALALATLLAGARFTVVEGKAPSSGWTTAGHGVAIESVTVTAGAPTIGVSAAELRERLGPDADLLGVISEETPELVEDEPDRPVRSGDRLVVAVRRSRAAEVLATLLG